MKRIVTFCTPCYKEDGEEKPAVTRRAAFDGKKERAIDVCEYHNAGINAASDLIEQYGDIVPNHEPGERKKHQSPRTPGGFPCDVCGQSFDSARALHGHQTKHRKKRNTVGVEDGEPCPDCGVKFKKLGVHRARAHGIKGESKSAQQRRAKKAAVKTPRKKTIKRESA
jgi:hypothetical protein